MEIPAFFVPYMNKIRLTDRQRRFIVGEMSAPGRHYHTMAHLAMMLDPWMLRDNTVWSNIFIAATFWHDIIYDPTRSDNEEQSAVSAKLTLSKTNFPDSDEFWVPNPLDIVEDWIISTKGHVFPEPDEFAPIQQRFRIAQKKSFLKADLAILWTHSSARYAWYARGVRQEYAHVPNEQYREGRAAVIKKLRDQISPVVSPEEGLCLDHNYEWEIKELQAGRLDV